MRRLGRQLVGIASFAMLSGCATNFEPKPLPPDHPASVQAQEAPRSGMKRLLTKDALTRTTKAQLARKDAPNPDFQSGGMSHDMSSMPGMDMSKPATPAPSPSPGAMEGMDHSKMKDVAMPAAAASPATKQGGGKPAAVIYTCVMHPEVQQPGSGTCPKCGMTLVKKETAAP